MRHALAAIAIAGALAVPQFTPAQTAAPVQKKKMTPPPPAAPRPFEFPKYSSRKLPNGLTVFVIEDHRQPLVSYSLNVLAGNIHQKPEFSGIASMTAALLREGTATRSSQQISTIVDTAGGSLGASAGDDFTTVSGTFMKTHADTGMELLADIAINPKFDQEELDRQMRQTQSGLAVSYNDPEYLRPLVSARAIYGTHPYAYPGSGTPQSLRAIKREQIVEFHKSWYAPSRAYLAISGDLTQEEAFAKAEKFLGNWKAAPSALPAIGDAPAPKLQVIVLDKPDAVQTQIGIGHLAVPRNHPDYLPLQIGAQIFGGSFNSRLNMKLRATEGLTYGAGASFQADKLAGIFSASTFTRTEKTADAIRMIVDLIKEWKANPATDDELNEAKAFLAGSYGLALETADAVAVRVLFQQIYDLPADYYTRFRENVMAITRDRVTKAVQSHLQPDKLSIVAVGNAKEFAKSLEAFGPVRIIPLADFDPIAPDMVRAREKVESSAEGLTKGKALMEAAAAAMGGKDKLLALKDVTVRAKLKVTMPQGAMDGEMVDSVLYPDKHKTTMSLMGTNIVQVVDGAAAYVVQGPQVEDVPPAVAKEFARSIYTTGGIGLVRAALSGGAEVLALAPAEVDGRKLNAVLWKSGETEIRIFTDPESNQMRKLSYRGAGFMGPGEFEIAFNGFKEFGGLTLPSSETISMNGNKVIDREVSAYDFNTGLDAAAFKKPSQ